MKALIPLLLLFSFSINAESYSGNIHSFDEGKDGEDHLLFLNDGRVIFFESSQKEQFRSIILNEKKQKGEDRFADPPDSDFKPTLLRNEKAANDIFLKMRIDYKEDSGQCYNMAHIWAYDEYRRSNLKSMKMFLFFTTKYIRGYDFPWWFHVAPLVKIKNFWSVSSLILDRRYTEEPMGLKEWTDLFIETERACKKVKKYTEYNKASQEEDCYLIETSMYFWQPKDIRRRDTEGIGKNGFYTREIQHALKEAFKP